MRSKRTTRIDTKKNKRSVGKPNRGNAAFAKVVLKLRKLLDDHDYQSALGNYGIGEEVREVADHPAAYGLERGSDAVRLLATQKGFRKDTIYNGLKVALAWPRKDFKHWLGQKGPDGRQLSFAHFVEVVKVEDPKARGALLDRVLSEGLSTRDLRAQCRKPKGVRRISGRRLLEATLKLNERALAVFADLAAWIAAFDGTGVVDVANVLDHAADLQHQLGELCRSNVVALHRKREGLLGGAHRNGASASAGKLVQLPFLDASNSTPASVGPAVGPGRRAGRGRPGRVSGLAPEKGRSAPASIA